LQAGGVAAELLKTGIADGDGSARTIKLELHTIVFINVSPRLASSKLVRVIRFELWAAITSGSNHSASRLRDRVFLAVWNLANLKSRTFPRSYWKTGKFTRTASLGFLLLPF
jgi:hypothetical protein